MITTFYFDGLDGLGSVVGLTDSKGALVGNETYHYDPYGLLIRQPHSAPLQVNPWRFASGFYDVSTGLYKFGIRYYDPNVGRWTQRDPVGGSLTETVKMNPYGYVGDDPVNEVDLSGALTWGCALLAAGTFLASLAGLGALNGSGNVLLGIAKVIGSGPDIVLLLTKAGLNIAKAAVPWFGWAALAIQAIPAAAAAYAALIAQKCI